MRSWFTLNHSRNNGLSRFLAGAGASTYLIILLCFVLAILNSMILLGAPLYALEMGASEAMLGILVAGFVACGAFLSLLGATLCDRLGLRSVIILSFCFFSAGYVVSMLAVSPSWLIPGQILAGVGDMLFTVGGFTYLAEVTPHSHQNLAHSVAFTALGVGVVSGSALAGYMAERVGFDGIFMLGILVSAVAVCLALCLSSVNLQAYQRVAAPRGVFAPYQAGYDLLRVNKNVRLVALLTMLGTLGWYTFSASFYLAYLHRLAISSGTIGLLRALGSTSMVLAPSLYFSLSSRIGALLAVLFGLLLGGLGLAMTPFLKSVLALAVVGTLAQTADRFRMPGVFTLLHMGTRSQERPTAIAIMNTSWALTAFVGGPFWGLIVRTAGLSNAFLLAGLAIMLGIFALYVRNRRSYGRGMTSVGQKLVPDEPSSHTEVR